jgi:hypothetical protein
VRISKETIIAVYAAVLTLILVWFSGRGWEQTRIVELETKLRGAQELITLPGIAWGKPIADRWRALDFQVKEVKPQPAPPDTTEAEPPK